jgi:hypothetical protein
VNHSDSILINIGIYQGAYGLVCYLGYSGKEIIKIFYVWLKPEWQSKHPVTKDGYWSIYLPESGRYVINKVFDGLSPIFRWSL